MNTLLDTRDAAKAAIQKLKGPSRVAKKLGILPWAVSKWTKRKIPAERVRDILEHFPGEITAHELRPDLFQPPD